MINGITKTTLRQSLMQSMTSSVSATMQSKPASRMKGYCSARLCWLARDLGADSQRFGTLCQCFHSLMLLAKTTFEVSFEECESF